MTRVTLTKTHQNAPEIKQSRLKRDWMDDTYKKHAYQCLPMTTANVHGWELILQQDVVAQWEGGNNVPVILEGGEYKGRQIAYGGIVGMVSFSTGWAFGARAGSTGGRRRGTTGSLRGHDLAVADPTCGAHGIRCGAAGSRRRRTSRTGAVWPDGSAGLACSWARCRGIPGRTRARAADEVGWGVVVICGSTRPRADAIIGHSIARDSHLRLFNVTQRHHGAKRGHSESWPQPER